MTFPMPDRRSHHASLVGHVVEDLTFEPLDAGRLAAEMTGSMTTTGRLARIKDGGFFVFADLAAGDYGLRLTGERLEAREIPVTLPFAPLRLAFPGDNELLVTVAAVDPAERRITFEPAHLPRRIEAGAAVLAAGLETTLTAELAAGPAVAARLESVGGVGGIGGIAPGALVRIVRERSIRLRPDPYAALPPGLTRLVGRVTRAVPAGHPVAGATVRLRRLGETDVEIRDVAGAAIAVLPSSPSVSRPLGTERDVTALTNARGDYHLYFSDAFFPAAVTLEASAPGLATAVRTADAGRGERRRVDFQMEGS